MNKKYAKISELSFNIVFTKATFSKGEIFMIEIYVANWNFN